jgi:predicted nuclease of restriction endonuclease-like RecB superfamily
MLTRELAIARREHGRVYPDRLTTATHAAYPAFARRMIDVYGTGTHKTRQDLHRSIVQILEEDPNCPVRRMGAFCKLLDEYGSFDRGKPKRAAELRRRVFTMAAQYHPLITNPESLLEHSEAEVKQRIASQLGMGWPELRQRLYEDLIENHRLRSFEGPKDPIELLSRYNVAQTQAALLDATAIRIEATTDWKVILRYAKLAGLMHSIVPTTTGYRIELDGPSSVLRNTHRYGASMAKFLPGLLSCQGWEMFASLRCPSGRNGVGPILELRQGSGLRSAVVPHGAFDSELERVWMEGWGSEPLQGWSLIREGEILVRGQRVFIPDFMLRHRDGRRVLLEIAGFWTPQYVQHKSDSLRLFADIPILVAIPKGNTKPWSTVAWSPLHRKILFGRQWKPMDVLEVLQEMTANT